MGKMKTLLFIGFLLVGNLAFFFSETHGSNTFDPWGECAMMCYAGDECAGFCYLMFEAECSNGEDCMPDPGQCTECQPS